MASDTDRGPVRSAPPPARHAMRVYLTRRAGRPVMYEYDDHGRPVKTLTYAPQAKRDYYQVGDPLFAGDRDKRVAERLFPQLRQVWQSKAMQFLTSDYVAGPKQTHKLGYVIVKIEPIAGSGGQGMVWLQAVLDLGTAQVILEEPREMTSRWLHDDFIWDSHRPGLMQTAWLSDTFMEILMEVAVGRGTGALRGALMQGGKETTVYVVRRGVMHAAREYLRKRFVEQVRKRLLKAGAAVGKGVVAFAVAFAKSYGENKSYQALLDDLKNEKSHRQIFGLAIGKGVAAFVSTLLEETLGEAIANGLDKGGYFRSEVSKYLTTRLTRQLTIGSFSAVVDALWEIQIDLSMKKAPNFTEAAKDQFAKALTGLLLGEVKGAAAKLASGTGGG